MSVGNRAITQGASLTAAVLFALIFSAPADLSAQRAVPRGQSAEPAKTPSGDSGKIPSSSAQPSGGDRSSGDGQSSGGGQTSSGTPRTAQRRPPSGSGSSGGGRAVVPRERNTSGDSGSADAGTSGSSAEIPPGSRPHGNNPVTGQAVARRGRPPVNGGDGDTVWVPGGYYGGYYPWGYGGVGLGGYYGGYYDPWYYGGQGYYYDDDWDGRLRLKVKPRAAEVFVDGYYAGIVDEYDGFFQRLRLQPGPHRIEIREEGFEPLSFDVLIQPDKTITYKGELRPAP
jgi:hypothetical protein